MAGLQIDPLASRATRLLHQHRARRLRLCHRELCRRLLVMRGQCPRPCKGDDVRKCGMENLHRVRAKADGIEMEVTPCNDTPRRMHKKEQVWKGFTGGDSPKVALREHNIVEFVI